MQSAIASARRMFASVWPTSDPINEPISSDNVGRFVSRPNALAKADLPTPGTPSNSTPRGRTEVE